MKRQNSVGWLQILVDGVSLSENHPINTEYFEVWRTGHERVLIRSKAHALTLRLGNTTREITLQPHTTYRVRKSMSVSLGNVFFHLYYHTRSTSSRIGRRRLMNTDCRPCKTLDFLSDAHGPFFILYHQYW